MRLFRGSFGLANLAYRNLIDQNEDQCICILGEKGSGKTESLRIILHFLTHLRESGTRRQQERGTKLTRCKSLASYRDQKNGAESPDRKPVGKCLRHQGVSPIQVTKCHISIFSSLIRFRFWVRSREIESTSGM